MSLQFCIREARSSAVLRTRQKWIATASHHEGARRSAGREAEQGAAPTNVRQEPDQRVAPDVPASHFPPAIRAPPRPLVSKKAWRGPCRSDVRPTSRSGPTEQVPVNDSISVKHEQDNAPFPVEPRGGLYERHEERNMWSHTPMTIECAPQRCSRA